nr:immunoglobulin heavy chain junction region [Macaca mulatta]MOV48141.1 immunoglobulin heavy chain junction region [Macaca mulatta]
CARVQVEFDYW